MNEPPTPYRDGRPLADIIPPDRRRLKTFALVVTSMIAGVGVWVLGGRLFGESSDATAPISQGTEGYAAGRIKDSILHGPTGDIIMPPSTVSVVHVWLQGCQDCMPAFEAMRALDSAGGLGVKVPVINVAYGEADPGWATRYGVGSNLVFDVGGTSVVRPLGIATFTTLVLDARGVILHRDRPDRPGYRDRVRAAIGAENLQPSLAPDPAPAFSPAVVEHVVAARRAGLKRACWDRRDKEVSSINLTVQIRIGTDGRVESSTATSNGYALKLNENAIARCIEGETRMWLFSPPPGESTTVNIPFKFLAQ